MDLTPYLTFEFSIAILAGFAGAYIRGFTGFGSNLIWAPALVTVMEPVQAVAIMGIVGLAGTTQVALPILKNIVWKDIYPIILASSITAPFGIFVLYTLNAKTVRQVIGMFILAIAIILLLRSARTRREPEWQQIEDEEIVEIMQEQWFFNYTAIMWGIWTTKWKRIQDKYLQGTRKSGALWFSKLSNEIWKITEDLWKHQNHCEHEDMTSRVNMERNEKVDAKIEEIYSRIPTQRRLLPMADRKFFRRDSEWIKRRRLKDKEKWCKQAEKIVKAYEKIAIVSREARLLRRYFLDNG